MAEPSPETVRPFALTIVADLGATTRRSSEPLPIQPGGAQDLFAALRPRLELRTPDRLTGAVRKVAWTPEFTSLRGFDFESLLDRFPPAIPLIAWRKRLIEASRAGSGPAGLLDALDSLWPDVPTAPRPTARPASTAPGPRPSGTGEVEALLDFLEGPAAPPETPAAPTAALGLRERLNFLLGMSGTPWEARLRQGLTAVDEALGRQIETILRDPVFRDLEAAWRSLGAIVEAADLRRGDLRLYALPATRAEAPEALAALLQRHESGWARASAGGAFLVDHPIGTDETSTGILGAAVLLASAVPGRVLLPLHPDLLGDGANHAAARPGPVADLAGSEALWALRELTAAVGGRRIVLTCNRFLYRSPYLPEDYPAAIGTFREDIAGAYGPYASAIWIAGRAMAETIRREGAAAALLIDAPVVGRVALRALGSPQDPEHMVPLEYVLSVPETRLLLDAGLAVLTCDRDRDDVVLRGLGAPGTAVADTQAQGPARTEGKAAEGLSSRLNIHLPRPVKEEEPLS